ncbi:MAG: ribosome biogenesis factor YjgA, partial [Betaproteobacteria bacterium]
MPRKAAPHRGLDVHYGEADPGDADARPSKSALKRQSHDLQALGLDVAELPEQRLAATPMPDGLREAILEYRRTKSHEGRRRQLQYVGKLMRSADEAVLREAVAAARLGSARETLALHEAERWRAELIADDAALTRWMQQHPDSDAQQLRSLVRAARRDAVAPEARQPRSHRELFQFIKARSVAADASPADAQPE